MLSKKLIVIKNKWAAEFDNNKYGSEEHILS